MVNDARAGKIESLHRNRKQILKVKASRKSWANTWFLKGQMAGTISCQATPGGVLAKSIQQSVNVDRKPGNKLLVLEDGGQSIVSSLNIKDPFWKGGCVFEDTTCIVKSSQRCDQSGVVYKITCNNCSQEVLETGDDTYNYVGCTRTSVHARMIDHLRKQRSKNTSGPLYRHDLQVHDGVQQMYTTEIIGKEKKILRMYTLEAKHMEKQSPALSMNDRQERSRRGGIVRLSANIEN